VPWWASKTPSKMQFFKKRIVAALFMVQIEQLVFKINYLDIYLPVTKNALLLRFGLFLTVG
jgi:hypothetical protein